MVVPLLGWWPGLHLRHSPQGWSSILTQPTQDEQEGDILGRVTALSPIDTPPSLGHIAHVYAAHPVHNSPPAHMYALRPCTPGGCPHLGRCSE